MLWFAHGNIPHRAVKSTLTLPFQATCEPLP